MRYLLIFMIFFYFETALSAEYKGSTFKYDIFTDEEKLYLENKKELKVCVKSDWMPYEDIQNGIFSGISADYLEIIFHRLDINLKIIEASSKFENIANLKAKKCDIKPIMSHYDEKILPFTLSKTYINDYLTLSTRIEQPFIANFDKYSKHKYAIIRGHYAVIKYLKKKYKNINFIEVDTILDALTMVANEEVFGYFGQSLASSYYIQKHFSAKLKVVNDFKSSDIGFGVVADDKILLSILNKVIISISEMKKREILNSWVSTTVEKSINYTFIWELVFVFIFILSIVLFFLVKQNHLKRLIEEQKEVFENIYQKSTDGILLLEKNRFIDCNESVVNILGYKSKEEFLNAHPWDISPKYQYDGLLSSEKSKEMDKVAYEKGTNCFEWIYSKNNGENIWVEVVLTKININKKDILHVVWRDIQRKKELEAELLKINRDLEVRVKEEVAKNIQRDKTILQQSKLAQMGEMISMIAHQWRQPLGTIASTTINMKLKLLLDTYDLSIKDESDEFKLFFNEKLDNIESYVQILTRTIDDFRDFYKPDKERISSVVDEPILKAFNIIKNSLISDDVKINKNFQSSRKIDIFASEIMQVVLNLLQNAQDNFKERNIQNPVVHLSSYDLKDRVVFEISDNGRGISSEIIEDIFNPYFSTKSKKNGTGLGLYMSKTIIEEHHNALLNVFNTDRGACFRVTFIT